MKWIDSLELKFGRYAIPGLVRLVVALNAFVFLLFLLNKNTLEYLYLNPELVKQGQVWRLVTYVFIPSLGRSWLMPDYLWLTFWLLFLWMIGDGLESVWGSFKLNLYYLIAMIGTTVVSFVFGSNSTGILINMSLLFAFATIDPDYPIYMLIFPIKIKWLAWFYFFLIALNFASGSLSLRMGILATMSNYAIFFGPEIVRNFRHRSTVAQRRARFKREALPVDDAMHRCAVCNRTEVTNPDLDFRVSADGNEYCVGHLPSKNAVT